MEAELEFYLTAANVDTQYAIRKIEFLVRTLALPDRLSLDKAFAEMEKLFARMRDTAKFGRPWTAKQIENCYRAKIKRFTRRPAMPMNPSEWATYQPALLPEECAEAHKTWRELKASRKISGERSESRKPLPKRKRAAKRRSTARHA
jgi:hypothetical protein